MKDHSNKQHGNHFYFTSSESVSAVVVNRTVTVQLLLTAMAMQLATQLAIATLVIRYVVLNVI